MNTYQDGQNILVETKPPSDFSLAFKQIQSPLIYILVMASLVTLYLRDYIDTAVILFAVFINTILGFIQERKAQHGLRALKKMLTPTARIIRDGTVATIDARDIVCGDTVLVSAGDRIPADGTLSEAVRFYVNEAILTGESVAVEKKLTGESSVYTGTTVASGRAQFKVIAIGMNTKIGQIALSLEQTLEEETPLQHQLGSLAQTLAIVFMAVCVFIFLIGVARGESLVAMFALAVAIAVAAIPEGMVVSLTVILSLGMQRILKRQAIVRRLVSAETLGSVSTLCVDKTGTLTEGIMRVVDIKTTSHDRAVKTAVYANNLENPIDIALWEWAQAQNHYDPDELNEKTPRLTEIPFDAVKKYMLVENKEGIWLKGAPEILLAQCKISEKEKMHWLMTINSLAEKGLRVIGLAWKMKHTPLTFTGVLGVSDPIREGVSEALSICKNAGADVKVVTGDYRLTSQVVLRQLGISITDAATEIMEGKELADFSVEELSKRIKKIKLFYRVTPDQKFKIVSALQQLGEVVAMTGDGVNDALALKKADIGIVLANASDVAKEAADLVLLDFNFRTIVAAIEEGRVMFHNIRKVVLYLLSDAFTEMILITVSIITFMPLPLTAIQILWINILSDGFPDLALAVEPKESQVMRELPRSKTAPIVDFQIKIMAGVLSASKALFALIAYLVVWQQTGNLIHAQTITFAIVGSGSLIYVFSTRNLSRSIFKDNFFKNPWLIIAVVAGFALQALVVYHPWLSSIFKVQALGLTDWLIVGFTGLILLFISETTKYLSLKRHAL